MTKKGQARKKLPQSKVERARKKKKVQKTLPPPERIQHQQVPKVKFQVPKKAQRVTNQLAQKVMKRGQRAVKTLVVSR